MVDDPSYDFLLQVCKGVQGKAKVYKEKKIDHRYCEECNVERMMYPNLGFNVCPTCGVCGDDIFVIGYDESTFIHTNRKCIYKRNEYFSIESCKVLTSRSS